MAAVSRSTLREILVGVAQLKSMYGSAVKISVVASGVGKAADPKWQGQVIMSEANNPAAPTTQAIIADDSGKIKMFGTLDALLKAFATVAESANGDYEIEVKTGAIFASKVPANIYTDAENKIVRLNKIKTAQTAKHGALVALTATGGAMFGWDTGNAAQVSRYEEIVAQAAAINLDVAAITAEVTRLQGVVDSNPAP